MGVENRDYARQERSAEGWTPVVKWLVVGNLAAYVLTFIATRLQGGPTPEALYGALALNPQAVLGGRVHQLLTYALLHDLRNPFPVILNAYLLWVAGRDLELAFGPGRLLRFYVGTVLATGGLYLLGSTLSGEADPPPLAGATAPAIALLVVHATTRPGEKILVFLLFELPIWIGVAIMVALSVAMAADGSPGGVPVASAVLGGAAVGFLANAFSTRAEAAGWFDGPRAIFGHRPAVRVLESGKQEAPALPADDAPAPAPPVMGATRRLEHELDQVLQKINVHGMASLTPDERSVLDRASRLYRGDPGDR
jgi:membrane associated rhomboid family serine protease